MLCSLFFFSPQAFEISWYLERLLYLLENWENILLRVNLAHFIFPLQHLSSFLIFFPPLGIFAWQWDLSCLRVHLLLLLISHLKPESPGSDIITAGSGNDHEVTNSRRGLGSKQQEDRASPTAKSWDPYPVFPGAISRWLQRDINQNKAISIWHFGCSSHPAPVFIRISPTASWTPTRAPCQLSQDHVLALLPASSDKPGGRLPHPYISAYKCPLPHHTSWDSTEHCTGAGWGEQGCPEHSHRQEQQY